MTLFYIHLLGSELPNTFVITTGFKNAQLGSISHECKLIVISE